MRSRNYRDEDLILNDGIILKSRLWIPNKKGPWPALLMRQPYGREIASTVTYAHPDWWASQGYLVVIQDVRGQGDSGGDFSGFAQEASDTSQTHKWVRSLPECNGLLGTYGFSYQGFTQLVSEKGCPPPDCMAPAMTGLSELEHWSCEGGAFWWHLGIGWGLQLAAQKALREKKWNVWKEIRKNLESNEYLTNGHKLLEKHDSKGMAFKWLKLSNEKQKLWIDHQPLESWLKKPMLLIGGWWDPHLKGILDIFEKSRNAGGKPKLIIGPATHLQWWEGINSTQLKFFDKHLKETTSKHFSPQINLWNLTTKKWEIQKKEESNPTFSLFSEGLACSSSEEGVLKSISEVNGKGEVSLVHDPWRPVPSIGGHLSIEPGEVDRSKLDLRSDIAIFTSDPMSEELRIEGIPTLKINTQCDRESFDLFVALSIIPKSMNIVRQISTGALRINDSEVAIENLREVNLQAMLANFQKGDRLRISISGSSWPAIGINPGNNLSFPQDSSPDCLVTTIILLLTNSKLEFKSLISS